MVKGKLDIIIAKYNITSCTLKNLLLQKNCIIVDTIGIPCIKSIAII